MLNHRTEALLAKHHGTVWHGPAELWTDPTGDEAQTSQASFTFGSDLLSYTWAYQGENQAGCFHFDDSGLTWQDSWHQPVAVRCGATGDEKSIFDVEYSYSIESLPEWFWRIKLSQRPDETLVLQMTNIAPWGEEARAVRMVLKKD